MPPKGNSIFFLTASITRHENSTANCSSWQNIKLKRQDRNKQNIESMFMFSAARSQFTVPQQRIYSPHSQANRILNQTKMLEIKTISLRVCTLNIPMWLDPNRTAFRTPQHIIKRNQINTIVGSASFSTLREQIRFQLDLCECLDTFQRFEKGNKNKVPKLDAGKLLNST